MTRIVYLHGFASGPGSSKARYFSRRFSELGVSFTIPQLDRGDFSQLTITNQLEVVEEAVGGRPAILMGSSLGGYLAACFTARHPEVEKLVMMAPAFHFAQRWRERLSPEQIDQWRVTNALPLFHYAAGEPRNLGYEFLQDAQRYEPEPEFQQPALILHGTRDEIVPAALSEAYAARHANVRLELFDSGHELTDVLDPLWRRTLGFLEALQ